jgi:A/G-specific adenine glycosylase
MHPFSEKIIQWYNKNKRSLPWRDTKDPYLIWLSEIILQQTRVDQGMSYYLKFAEEFPTVKDLAEADNDKVMKLWQGLGYYSRARNLHETAKIITQKNKGVFPDNYSDVLSLKGIGEYTASAIISFAFDKPYAVVDGNVYRLLSRVFGISTPIDSSQGKKEFTALANELLYAENPALFNQAIMEFGAMQCKPVNPNCEQCPLNTLCIAYSNKTVDALPVKAGKTKVRDRYFNYIVFNYNGLTAIQKRTQKDIWLNLYEFPNIETITFTSEEDFLRSKEWQRFIGDQHFTIKTISGIYKHILSHQRIHARFWEVNCKKSFDAFVSKTTLSVSKEKLHEYAVPRLIDKYLQDRKKKLDDLK